MDGSAGMQNRAPFDARLAKHLQQGTIRCLEIDAEHARIASSKMLPEN